MADAAGVHELRDNLATAVVDRVGDQAPARDLLVSVQPGGVRVALADRRGLSALTHNQPRAGALAVVLGGERGGGLARTGAVASQRGHHEAVSEAQLTEGISGEQVSHVVSKVSGYL